MNEQVIQPKSLGGFVRSLSGLFITQSNSHGLTPKECTITALLISILNDNSIVDTDKRLQLANKLNQPLQVTRNYLAVLKKKGVITKENKLHPIFFKNRIVIENGKDTL